jgi:hypothetical protein
MVDASAVIDRQANITHTNETFYRDNPSHTIQSLGRTTRLVLLFFMLFQTTSALSLCSGVYTLVTVVTIIWDYEVFQPLRA